MKKSFVRSSRETLFAGGQRSGLEWLQLPGELLVNAFKAHSQPGIKSVKHQFKFVARGLISPRLTRAWFDLWRTPKLAPLAQSHPRLLLKLQRPYLRHGLDGCARWALLSQHYRFALDHFSAAALKEIFTPPGALLAEIPVDGVGGFTVRLFYHDLYEKEGELSLVFFDEQKQARMFILSFCISAYQPGWREIFVGGLQGFKAANEREFVVAVTRGMFGLRPKALLLFALQQLAARWHVRNIYAVSNQTRHLRRKPRAIATDYDQFWMESGGQLDADGDFVLPVTFAPRPLETIKPNKRTMYRRRYEMLDSLGGMIGKNLIRLSGNLNSPDARTARWPARKAVANHQTAAIDNAIALPIGSR